MIRESIGLLDARLFEEGPMGLREQMLSLPMADRLSFDPRANRFFVNFEGLSVR